MSLRIGQTMGDRVAPTPAATAMREPANRLDPRMRRVWATRGLAILLPLPTVSLIATALPTPARPLGAAALMLSTLACVAAGVVVPVWRDRVHRWEVTPDAVYTRSGWWRQTWRIAPMSRVQTVDVVRGPLHRRCGLACVIVTTASAAGPLEIDGLAEGAAGEVAASLALEAQTIDGDAT